MAVGGTRLRLRNVGCAMLAQLLVAGCVMLAVPDGWEVAVQNESGTGLVAEVQVIGAEGTISRFYPVEAGALIVVDTVGHNNGPPYALVMRDRSCNEVATIRSRMDEGALIVVPEAGPPEVESGREADTYRPGSDLDYGETTCELGAAQLEN